MSTFISFKEYTKYNPDCTEKDYKKILEIISELKKLEKENKMYDTKAKPTLK